MTEFTTPPIKKNVNRALDFLNVSVAGMRDGVGPLLTLYLVRETHLDPTKLSWVLAAPSFAALFAQVPMGFLYDRIEDKRLAIAAGAALLGVMSVAMSFTNNFGFLMLCQVGCGLAMCLLSVGIPAVSLATAKVENFGARIARNELFSKAGNFGAIAITGFIAQAFSLHWIFYLVAIFAAPVIFSSLALPNVRAERPDTEMPLRKGNLRDLATNRPYLNLLALCFIFQFANASLLMVFELSYAKEVPTGGAGLISSAIFLTQLVIMVGTLWIARIKTLTRPFQLLSLGFLMILGRGLIFGTFGVNVFGLGVAQILDGGVAALLIVVPLRTIAMMNRGRFNVMSGLLGTSVALGASLSTLTAGFMIQHAGFSTTFFGFAAVALAGLLAAQLLESRQPEQSLVPLSTHEQR